MVHCFLQVCFVRHGFFQGRSSGLAHVLLLAGLGFFCLFVCIFFFLLPLLLSELTLLKVNVALVPAESVLWKESLFIPLLKISFKRSKKCNAFLINLCISPSLRNLLILIHGKKTLEPVSFVPPYWKDHLGFQSVELRWRMNPAHDLQYTRRRFCVFSHQSGILSVQLSMDSPSKPAVYPKWRNLSALRLLTSLFCRSDKLQWREV